MEKHDSLAWYGQGLQEWITNNNVTQCFVFHHYDADGYAAAAVIKGVLMKNIPDQSGESGNDYFVPTQFISVEHGKPMGIRDLIEPLGVIQEGRTLIFIVDYGFSREDDQEEIRHLAKNDNNIFIWIDHHESSKILDVDPVFGEFAGLRILTKGSCLAGCALTYIWIKMLDSGWGESEPYFIGQISEDNRDFANSHYGYPYWDALKPYKFEMAVESHRYGSIVDSSNPIKRFFERVYKRCPDWIWHTSDYDTWTHEDEQSKDFVKGANFQGLHATYLSGAYVDGVYTFGLYADIIACRDMTVTSDYPDIMDPDVLKETGRTVAHIDEVRNRRKIKYNSFVSHIVLNVPVSMIDPNNELNLEADADGVIKRKWTALCINAPGNSLTFGSTIEDYDLVVTMTFDGENFKYSFFSRKENGAECHILALSCLATYHITGGGHLHASGTTTPNVLLWKDDTTFINQNGVFFSKHKTGN